MMYIVPRTPPPPLDAVAVQGSSASRHYPCRVLRVIDGDTLELDIDLGFEVALHKTAVRLRGLDAPELHTAAGKKVAKFVQAWVENKHLELVTLGRERDKYGRALGQLRDLSSGQTLNEVLLTTGQADKTTY